MYEMSLPLFSSRWSLEIQVTLLSQPSLAAQVRRKGEWRLPYSGEPLRMRGSASPAHALPQTFVTLKAVQERQVNTHHGSPSNTRRRPCQEKVIQQVAAPSSSPSWASALPKTKAGASSRSSSKSNSKRSRATDNDDTEVYFHDRLDDVGLVHALVTDLRLRDVAQAQALHSGEHV